MTSSSEKIRVAVLYGGRSGEHEVSLMSAANVIQYLDRSRFEVVPIGIDKQGVWYLGEDVMKLGAPQALRLHRAAERMLFKPDSLSKSQPLQTSELLANSKKAGKMFDVVFPVIHGVLCEDGTVQGLLELADVPYVGCHVLASAVCMDKDVSKRLISQAGIAVPPYLTVKRGQWEKNPKKIHDLVSEKLTYPVFVKPANTGSSVGVEKVKTPQELGAMIKSAFRYDTKIVIEQGIDAIELEVAILENSEYGSEPFVSVVGEVKPNHEFYSYTAKYLDENGADLLIPATISKELQEKAREVAKQVFTLLECEGMARVDLFLDRKTQQIYFNEANTLPGFTKISMYPKMMEASGISYTDLLTRLVMLALNRHERNSKLLREYAELEGSVVEG